VSHASQHTPAVFQVTALLQEPQGYLSVLGPGFGSGAYEFANNMAQRYNNTSKSGFNLYEHQDTHYILFCATTNSHTYRDSESYPHK
jgi:hypothetical protein